MDVRIGVQQSAKEIEVDLGDSVDKNAIVKDIEKVFSDKLAMLWMTDKKGKKVGIAVEKIAYIEIDSVSSERRMGFVG